MSLTRRQVSKYASRYLHTLSLQEHCESPSWYLIGSRVENIYSMLRMTCATHCDFLVLACDGYSGSQCSNESGAVTVSPSCGRTPRRNLAVTTQTRCIEICVSIYHKYCGIEVGKVSEFGSGIIYPPLSVLGLLASTGAEVTRGATDGDPLIWKKQSWSAKGLIRMGTVPR